MKKTMSMLLALAMVFSLIPVTAFAADNPAISFATTFTDDMSAGDTFTVTANLDSNPGVMAITLSLKWNDQVVKFTGFETEYDEDEDADVLVSDVLSPFTVEYNQELGIIVAARTKNSSKTGTLFVANFEIIGGGELGIGLKDGDDDLEFANENSETYTAQIDDSAIAGLTAAGDAAVPMPEDAPFTAIITDAGPIVAIEEADWVNGVPYYIVTIPADAETAYVTAPDQVVMEDYNTGKMQATGYAAEVDNGWNQLYISYDYTESEDGPIVEIPMNMVATDWSGEVELCFVEDEEGYLTHAFGIEDATYACLGWISFRYGTGEEEEEPETYSITVDPDLVGGTITVGDHSC